MVDDFPWSDEDRFGTARTEAVEAIDIDTDGALEATGGNRQVNSSSKFEDIRQEYIDLFHDAVIRPEHLGSAGQKWSVLWLADQIVAHRQRYEGLATPTEVPWFFIGILHALECSFSFERHLYNGDPLSGYTTRYPPGYPKDKGRPPFSFEDSAASALTFDGLVGQKDWSLARTLFRMEAYNGMSYRTKLAMASPYLWSFSNLYVRGKFKEVPKPGGGYKSIYDPNLQSKQCGAAVMLKALVDRGAVILATS